MFKGLFQLIFGLIRLLFFGAIFIIIFHTWAIKQAVTFSLSYQLGADVSIQSVKMDWKNTGFEIQGLEIGNPYSFPRGIMADIPMVIVSADLPSIFQGVWRFKTVGVNLRELQVVNASQKGLNVLAVKALQRANEKPSSSPAQEAVHQQIEKYKPQVVIDEFIFSLGDISYLDMTGPTLKQNRYKAGIRGATYYDVRGTQEVAVIVVTEALKKIGFGFIGTQLQKLQGRVLSSAGKKGNFLSQAVSALTETFSK